MASAAVRGRDGDRRASRPARREAFCSSHAGNPPDVAFLYDYGRLDGARGSFVDAMNRCVLANAGRKGYETVDMQPRCIARYREHGQRFEWPRDVRRNARGHERCFEAVAGSELPAAAVPVRPRAGA